MHKKWYIQGELFRLAKKKEKKLATAIAGFFPLEKPRLKSHINLSGIFSVVVVALSAFIISAAGNSTIELAFSNFDIGKSCLCLNSSLALHYKWVNCSRIITFHSQQLQSSKSEKSRKMNPISAIPFKVFN